MTEAGWKDKGERAGGEKLAVSGIEHRPPVLEVPVLAFAISRALPDGEMRC
jgi:hypothetical protein